MKFLYGYKTKDNEMREGEICAPSRDAVYRELKTKGIKPFKVDLAPGFGNWLASLGKRTYAIVALCVLCLVLCAVVVRTSRSTRLSSRSPLPRHQIYGDPALMDELARTDYAEVFSHPGERLLAKFAQPGNLDELPNARDLQSASNLVGCLSHEIVLGDGESREVAEMKRIVLWMKGELRDYLSNGIGTPERYLRRLNERQRREAQIYFTAQNDLRDEKSMEKWERINGSLRAMGLPTIPAPITQTGDKK